jgi:pilus assembly protein Flp/PilA
VRLHVVRALSRPRRGAGHEHGATAVEYGLLIALVAVVIITVVIVLGGQVSGGFQGFVNLL